MPILFVHGVAARSDNPIQVSLWKEIRKFLRTYIAPIIASDPEEVLIDLVYWGDIGSGLAWNGASCPPATVFVPVRNEGLDTITALRVAKDPADVMKEASRRFSGLLGNATTRMTGVARAPLHPMIMQFFGDIFIYINNRGTPEHPGPIPLRILSALKRAQEDQNKHPKEPIVVLSHSMGGQLIYDTVTAFLPHSPDFQDIRIDYWCACSSQVGLFEEMKLFLKSTSFYHLGNPVPFPERKYLGDWWNVWDPNDLLSFTVHNIISGVDDSAYDSGVSAAEAHLVVLQQYSFYALFAKKLREAKRKCFMK